MPASTVEQLTELLPHVEFMQLCGQTEGGPGGIYLTGEQVRARPDASGRQPLPLTESRVVSLHGQDTLPGEVGELILRGETVMKGYWNKPAETAEALRDGWLHTGDLARVDADGFVTLVDRLKDLIITGGRNVYSVEVENALAAHPRHHRLRRHRPPPTRTTARASWPWSLPGKGRMSPWTASATSAGSDSPRTRCRTY
ncbi:hypothetical protein GCM10020295_81050 [Streptomyces cinereospinus]